VPEDIAIVGYDGIEFAEAAAVPLTSVSQPRQLLGRTAAELLLAESREPVDHEHQQVMFAPELVVRASTRLIPALRPSCPSRSTAAETRRGAPAPGVVDHTPPAIISGLHGSGVQFCSHIGRIRSDRGVDL
jgi:hypothetical protein